MNGLTRERLHEALTYSSETGLFKWLVRPSKNVRIGAVAGCLTTSGYVLIGVDGEDFLAHRLAYFYMYGMWPAHHLDHVNGIRSDNRAVNIREASNQENMQNLRVSPAGAKHHLLGASPNRKGNAFRSFIKVNGRQIYLGTYPTAELAHVAYVQAKRVHHPRGTL